MNRNVMILSLINRGGYTSIILTGEGRGGGLQRIHKHSINLLSLKCF